MQADSILSMDAANSEFQQRKVIAGAVRSELGDWSSWLKSNKLGSGQLLRKLLSKNCLFWGLPTIDIIHQPVIARLLQVKSKDSKTETPFDYADAVEQWRASLDESRSLVTLLEALAWAHALPCLPTRLGEEVWTELLATLLQLSEVPKEASAITRFIAGVELPMTLAHSLPEVSLCKAKRKLARQRFTDLLDEVLDGQGMPHGQLLADIQYLLASSTRTLAIDAEAKKSRISKAGQLQYDWLTRQTLRWARPNGACILKEASDSPHFDEMMKYALQFAEDESDLLAFKLLRGKRKAAADDVPDPSEHSEWSELATMRSCWLPSSVRLATNYNGRKLHLELGVGAETILSGLSEPSVVIDGTPLSQESDWADVCWESDKDLDYLELECTFSGDWKVQRQLLLARKDQFVLIADAIMGPTVAEIEYQHTLPLVEGIELEQSNENTEAVILGQKKMGHILPLGLPEWKSAQRNDRLRAEPARLEMSATANALYAPIFINLNPALRNKPLTWRQLTVAEEMLIVANDVAVAYRIQVGSEQWVIYRSLATPGNRTLLGLNLISDFYVARFQPDGEAQMLIDVEPS